MAGLVAVTLAAGYISAWGETRVRILGGLSCCGACRWRQGSTDYDDLLDVFRTHGVGGIVGVLLTGVFALETVGGAYRGNRRQRHVCLGAVRRLLALAWWSALAGAAILTLVRLFMPLRLTEEEEVEGLPQADTGR